MAMKKATAKKATVKKSLPKAQAGGYTSPYGGTGANKPKSNKSAVVAGIIGSAVGTAAALFGRKKKKKAKELEKKVKQDVIKEAESREVKKYGGAKKPLKKAQYGNSVLEGPLPEFAAANLENYANTYPIPNIKYASPSDNRWFFGKEASNLLRDPNKSMHHQATNQFYNTNKNLHKTDRKAYEQKLKESKPAVLNEIAKRQAVTNNTVRMATKPATPIQKKGGSTSSTKKSLAKTSTGTTKMKKGGSTGDKKWIQKAINPKHKGYCTPMTKATCTPKRKALAITLKKMAKARKGK